MSLQLRKLRLLFKLLTKIIRYFNYNLQISNFKILCWVKKYFKQLFLEKKQFIKNVWGKYPIELKAYLDLWTVREISMGKIKTWKIDVWFIENKNINIFREHTKFWYFIVW